MNQTTPSPNAGPHRIADDASSSRVLVVIRTV